LLAGAGSAGGRRSGSCETVGGDGAAGAVAGGAASAAVGGIGAAGAGAGVPGAGVAIGAAGAGALGADGAEQAVSKNANVRIRTVAKNCFFMGKSSF